MAASPVFLCLSAHTLQRINNIKKEKSKQKPRMYPGDLTLVYQQDSLLTIIMFLNFVFIQISCKKRNDKLV